MRLLGRLRLRPVASGLVAQELVPVPLLHRPSDRVHGLVGKLDGIRAHVRNVPGFVERLSDPHRLPGSEIQFSVGLLLQRRGREGRIGTALRRLLLDGTHLERRPRQPVAQRSGFLGTQEPNLAVCLQLARRLIEVPARGYSVLSNRDQNRLELATVAREAGQEIPVLGRAEGTTLALSLDEKPDRHRLDAARREAAGDLLPQKRRELEADQAVQDSTCLLRLDEPHVQRARVLHRLEHRPSRDLVEADPSEPLSILLVAELLCDVERDRLALAVRIRGEENVAGLFRRRAQLLEDGTLAVDRHVLRLEAGLNVHSETALR